MNRTNRTVLLLFVLGLLPAIWLRRDLPGRDAPDPIASNRGYQRICSLSPALTECLFALGQGNRIVGVSDFTRFPPEARDIPSLGGYINPNLDRLMTLRPDLVIYQHRPEQVATFCAQNEIVTLAIEKYDTIADIKAAIALLGQQLGSTEQATLLIRQMEEQLAGTRRNMGRRPRVLLCMFRTPGSFSNLTTVGSGGYLHELIEWVGGQNVFADLTERYPQVSTESLLLRQPDVIIEAQPGERVQRISRERTLADWQVLSSLPAVRNERITVVDESQLFIPGPRLPQIARVLNQIIHEEAEHE